MGRSGAYGRGGGDRDTGGWKTLAPPLTLPSPLRGEGYSLLGAELAGGLGAHLLHGARLLVGVALVLPGVGMHVVAVDFPEAGRVDVEELEATQPLCALPEVELGHDQAEGPAVVGREVLAVA